MAAWTCYVSVATAWLTAPVRAEVRETCEQIASGVRDTYVAATSTRSDLRPDIFQICGGKAAISAECADLGLRVANVADKMYGWDLKDPQQMEMVKRYITNVAPKFVTIELPKMNFSDHSAQNKKRRSPF